MAQQIGIKLSLDGAAGVLSGLGQVQGGLGNLGTKITTVRDALTSFAPALASAFTVGGLTAFIKNTTNAIDAMNDLADATGATIEEISKLDQVARRNGASLDSVGGMLVKFNNALKEADGKNGASMALQAIGLEASKLRALDPAEALQQTARALAGFADDGNKARLVQELFGKSVREAAPFLKDLAEAGVLNASVTTQQAAEAEKFNKQLFAIQANATDAARGLVGDLLPALNSTLEKVIELNKVGWFKMFGKEITAEIKNVKLSLAGARLDDLAGALAKDPGNRGLQAAVKAARQDVDGLLKDSVAATQALKDLVGLAAKPNAGGGRGFVNPPMARAAPSVGDISGRGSTTAALDLEAKATAAAIQAREKYLDTLTATSSKMAQENTALADQVAALTLGKDAYQRMIDVREEEAAVLLETQAIRALDRNLDAREYEALMAQAAAIRQRIVLRRDLADATVQATDREIMARRAGLIDQDAAGALIDEQISKADALIAGIDGQTRALTMSNTEREISIALLELERTGLDKNSDAYRDRAQAIREAITNRETVREGIEQARRFEQEWQRTADQIGQSLSDALMQGGKSAADYIKGLFRTTVLRPIIQAIVNPVTGAIGGMLGMGNAMAGTTGAASMASGLGGIGGMGGMSTGFGGLLSSLVPIMNGTTGSMLGLSAVNSGLGQALGLSSAQTIGGNVIVGPTGLGSMLGSGLGMLGNGFAGYGISRALSGGYSAGGAVNTIAGIASMIPGIGPIAGVVGGLVNRAFGMKAKEVRDQGIVGSLTAGTATGQQYQDWFQKGGWFRSNKSGTNFSALGDDMSAALGAGSHAMFQQTQAFAQVLSLPAAALATITSQFKTKLTGDAAKDQAEITALFTRYGEDLAETYRDQLAPFQKAGETISTTLQRMSGLQQFSNTINDFGGIFSRVANLSVDAKEQLLGFAGGIEALLSKTQNFVNSYYEETEKLGLTARAVQQQLGTLGITGELYSRADFRRLVESTDVSSEEGRQRLSQLLDIANAFAPVGQFLEAQGGSLSLLANTAPASGTVSNILGLGDGLGGLTAATNAAADATVTTLERLISRVGELETALVKALDKSGRAVSDSMVYEPLGSWR